MPDSLRDSLPVIIGVGQMVDVDMRDGYPSPLSLAVKASRAALADAMVANLAGEIDTVAFVRINSDSIPGQQGPFGRCDNLPRALARELGADPQRAIYTAVGGQTPQQMINELGASIAQGDVGVALLAGSEAIAAMKNALRSGEQLDWDAHEPGTIEDRGTGPELLTRTEIAGGMGNPPQVYAAFEHAWRAAQGNSVEQQRAHMAKLFVPFSEIAARNPYAQFPQAKTAEFLSTPSAANYPVADPYLKWHVAQDAVNQGAAVLLTSVGKAKALGVPREKWVFPLGGADCMDKLVTLRPRLDASAAMAGATSAALAQAHTAIDDVAHLDLYSCFPCAVQFACDALGNDSGKRQLTLTGGLPYFGGAGNNYSMHGIASMVETLRADKGSRGLVLANGGFLSKESVGVYSTVPNAAWQPVDNRLAQAQIDDAADFPQASAPTEGVIETYSVLYVKTKPLFAYVFGRNAQGRFLARTDSKDEAAALSLLDGGDPIGRKVRIEPTAKRNRLLL